MRWRAGIATTVGALFVFTLVAPEAAVAYPARAVPAVAPLGFPATVDTTLPTGARRITVTVAAGSGGKGAGFASMYTALASVSNNQRLLFCSVQGATAFAIADQDPQFALASVARRDTMQMCFQIVAHLTAPRAGVRADGHERSTACASTVVAVRVSTGAGGEDASVTATGGLMVARKPALRVRCRLVGDTMILTIRTTSRKSTLLKVVGERLTIGFASAPSSPADIPVRLTFGRPR